MSVGLDSDEVTAMNVNLALQNVNIDLSLYLYIISHNL